MTKQFCDGCGNEITERSYRQIICGKSQPVSGVDYKYELCLPCYNELMFKLWDNLLKIKKLNKNE